MHSYTDDTPTLPPISSEIDLTLPPYLADPTGQTDSTAAIVAALNAVLEATVQGVNSTIAELDALPFENGRLRKSCENRRQDGKSVCIFPQTRPYAPTLYFPPGTYLVSDTIQHTLEGLHNSSGAELSWQIRFRGAGPDKSILRLEDFSPGFAGPTPKPVMAFKISERRSNVAMSNYFEDLCIETGCGNPSAIGLDFFANNSGAVRNVSIRSGDGRGFAGMYLGKPNYSGILLKNISTEGFDYGCHFDSSSQTMFFAAENLTIRQPNIAGIYVGGISASLRAVDYAGNVPALISRHPSGHVILVDSELQGTGSHAIDHRAGAMFVDNVKTTGFDVSLRSEFLASDPDQEISQSHQILREIVLPTRCDSHTTSPVKRLPVKNTPLYRPLPDARTVGVQDFGAAGDGMQDDSAAIQAAMDSGASEIVFEPGRYQIAHPIRIPATVERIGFNFVDLVAAPPLETSAGSGAFQVTGFSERPLFIEDLFAWEEWCGSHVMFDHACTRTLILSDLHTQTLCLYKNSIPGGEVFIENVATTAGVVPGATKHGRSCLRLHGQKVWARQINPERGEPMILNDGGALWILGFKSEDEGVAVHTVNGGQTEVLGGVLNGGSAEAVAFVSDESEVRISAVSNGWVPKRFFGTSVLEKRNGSSQSLPNSACLSRQLPEKRGPQVSISLYSSPAL